MKLTIHMNIYIYVYIGSLCMDPEQCFCWVLMVVEYLLCNFNWKYKNPFARSSEKQLGIALGTYRDIEAMGSWARQVSASCRRRAILKYRLLAAGIGKSSQV